MPLLSKAHSSSWICCTVFLQIHDFLELSGFMASDHVGLVLAKFSKWSLVYRWWLMKPHIPSGSDSHAWNECVLCYELQTVNVLCLVDVSRASNEGFQYSRPYDCICNVHVQKVTLYFLEWFPEREWSFATFCSVTHGHSWKLSSTTTVLSVCHRAAVD